MKWTCWEELIPLSCHSGRTQAQTVLFFVNQSRWSTDRISKTTAKIWWLHTDAFFFVTLCHQVTGSTPLEVGELWGRWSCQDMHVDVRSWQSINVAVREMGACLKWLIRAPLLVDIGLQLNKHFFFFPLSAFHFAEMLNINAVFQTQSALFPVFSFSLPFPFTAPATALRCFNEAETLKALIRRSLRSRWDLSIG